MDFAFSEEQCLIRDSFRGALRELVNIDRVRRAVEAEQHVDTTLWTSLIGMGMSGLMIAEEFGGAGLGLLEAAVVAEELGRTAAPVPFAATVVMVPLALSSALDSAAQRAWLPGLADGDTRMGLAIPEAAAGKRHGQGIAVTDGKLSGQTPFALDASGATALMICDQDGGLHLVSCDDPGIEFRAFESIDGTRSVADLTLKHVPATP